MNINERLSKGILLLGCGKMGSAMLQGWLNEGFDPKRIWVIDPKPSNWLQSIGVNLNEDFPKTVNLALIAVNPQVIQEALPQLLSLTRGRVVFLSVAAGIPLKTYEDMLGVSSPIVRAMPNTPAAIGKGISALIGNNAATEACIEICETLLSAIGQTVRLESENQMDAVTGVSGSGPAYVFYMVDALAAAARQQGLPEDLSMVLAKATVAGAGALALQSSETPRQLRINVTSPNGTSQAGLEVLMNENSGLVPLISETVSRATDRSRELSNASN